MNSPDRGSKEKCICGVAQANQHSLRESAACDQRKREIRAALKKASESQQ